MHAVHMQYFWRSRVTHAQSLPPATPSTCAQQLLGILLESRENIGPSTAAQETMSTEVLACPCPLVHTRCRRFGHVTYVTVAVRCGKLMRKLARRFDILQRIRVEAEGGKEEEEIAKDPNAVMSREQWPAPCWKVR